MTNDTRYTPTDSWQKDCIGWQERQVRNLVGAYLAAGNSLTCPDCGEFSFGMVSSGPRLFCDNRPVDSRVPGYLVCYKCRVMLSFCFDEKTGERIACQWHCMYCNFRLKPCPSEDGDCFGCNTRQKSSMGQIARF